MPRTLHLLLCGVMFSGTATGASRAHVVSLGKWMPIKWCVGTAANHCLELKARALYVDGKLKEFTLGGTHEVTERLFVVQRAFRVNDALPAEAAGARWVWQRGGWLVVDRSSGRITPVSLPEFDAYYSVASWYRDYAAYCGVSDDGKKLYAIVFQLGRRKPVLKKPLGDPAGDDMPDSECPAPVWQRQPARVSFEPDTGQHATYAVRGHAADLVSESEEEDVEK